MNHIKILQGKQNLMSGKMSVPVPLDNQLKRVAAYWAEGWLVLYRAFEAHLITSAIDNSIDGQWLDAGCGDGQFAALLTEKLSALGTIVGIDIDEVRLARARLRAGLFNTQYLV